MITAALVYAARGWPIFPVKRDKTPLTPNGVLDATTSERQVHAWWAQWPEANVALDVGGAGMMVLDLDPGHDLKELERNVGQIPATKLRASTPRGGSHFFFALASEEHVSPSSSKLASHVDVRSFHSYVLLPPSQTEAGAYACEAYDKPAYRTDDMVRVANSAREKHQDRDNWIIEADLPENVVLATKWLRDDAKPAVEGQGGEACAYATATMCKSYGVSEETAFDLCGSTGTRAACRPGPSARRTTCGRKSRTLTPITPARLVISRLRTNKRSTESYSNRSQGWFGTTASASIGKTGTLPLRKN